MVCQLYLCPYSRYLFFLQPFRVLLGSIARQDQRTVVISQKIAEYQRLGRAPLFSDRLLIDVQGGSGVRMPEQLLGDLHVNTPLPEELRETVAE